jgi:ABC-type nitrate/sulfonate/bicarbonate transport system permease component
MNWVALLGRRNQPATFVRAIGGLGRSRALGWMAMALLLSGWQVLGMQGSRTAAVLPPVTDIAARLVESLLHGALLGELGDTIRAMALGYAAGVLAGLFVGALIGRSRTAYVLLEPLLELTRPVPIAAIIPLLILFLGIDDALKIGAVAIASFFPVVINTSSAVRGVPATLRETAATFGLSPIQAMREIVLPYAAPMILVGLRQAVSISLIVTVFTEMISGNTGIGYFILASQQTLTILDLYVGLFTLAIVGYMLNAAFQILERGLVHWHESSDRRSKDG